MGAYSDFKIAGSVFRVYVADGALSKLRNFNPFVYSGSEKPLFSVLLDSIVPSGGTELYSSDEFQFKLFDLGEGFKLLFHDIETNKFFGAYFDKDYKKFITDMRSSDICASVLNNIIMLAFTFATIDSGSLLIHSSVAVVDGKAYMFLGKSGTGKSTHCKLWLNNIKGADILNDDNPILKLEDDCVYVYGSAWSGKGCVYKNERYPVGGIVRLAQAKSNNIVRKSGTPAFALLYTSCSKMPWSSEFMAKVCSTLSVIVQKTPIYYLECLPNADAAILSYNTMK